MPRRRDSARRIFPLAWPVFLGQIAVLAFSTVDTLLVARSSAVDLAALAIGSAAYNSVFIGLMGVVLAVGPIAGQAYGAGKPEESGHHTHQAMWLALGLSAIGCTILLFPDPFLALAHAEGDVADKARSYLRCLAFALPPALLFTAFRGFNLAVSRAKAVMALQIGALCLKVPLSALLVFGWQLPAPFDGWRIAAHGTPGCGAATAIVMLVQLLAMLLLLRRDPFYAGFGLARRWSRPSLFSLAAILRLGVPMGLSIVIEVTSFTFMALFISRIGAITVAGHQIAVNMVSMMFMMPLAIANASGVLVAQRLGAGDADDAQRIGRAGLEIGVLLAVCVGAAVYLLRSRIVGLYTADAVIVASAVPLLAWVGLFHVADAAQTVSAFVLRAHRIATVPLVIYGVAIWVVGLGGGYVVAFDIGGIAPRALQGAQGFWSMATLGVRLAALGMSGYLTWMWRRERRVAVRVSPAAARS